MDQRAAIDNLAGWLATPEERPSSLAYEREAQDIYKLLELILKWNERDQIFDQIFLGSLNVHLRLQFMSTCFFIFISVWWGVGGGVGPFLSSLPPPPAPSTSFHPIHNGRRCLVSHLSRFGTRFLITTLLEGGRGNVVCWRLLALLPPHPAGGPASVLLGTSVPLWAGWWPPCNCYDCRHLLWSSPHPSPPGHPPHIHTHTHTRTYSSPGHMFSEDWTACVMSVQGDGLIRQKCLGPVAVVSFFEHSFRIFFFIRWKTSFAISTNSWKFPKS